MTGNNSRAAGLKADLRAGLSATMVSLPVAVGGGIAATAALGQDFVSIGVKAALVCAIVAALVTAAFGSSRFCIAGPSSATSAVLAGVLVQVSADGASSGSMLLMLALVVAMSGTLLVVAGTLRWGSLIKFIPRPVTAGFVNGLAVLLTISQLRGALGVPGTFGMPEFLLQIHWGALAAAVATVLVCIHAPRLKLPIPPAFAGLSAGVAIHYLAAWLLGEKVVGPTIGNLPGLFGAPEWLVAGISPDVLDGLPWGNLLAAAVLLSVITAVQTLMTAVSVDSLAHSRHDSNRELVGYGLGNIAAAFAGGIASSGNLGRAMASFRAGAASRLTGVFNAFFMLLIVLLVSPWVSAIPIAVMSGILIHSAIVMFDKWALDQLRRWTRGEERGEITENVLVNLVMMLGMIWMNPAIAVGVGVVLTMLLFLRRMSRTFVRGSYTGEFRRSLKRRPEPLEAYLQRHGGAIHVVELEGALFFGTADRLRSLIESQHGAARFVILDCRRVREWDATGVQILGQTYHALKKRGARLMLAHVTGRERLEAQLRAYGLNEVIPEADRFADTDRALEAAEDVLLADVSSSDAGNAAEAVTAASIFSGLDPAERRTMLGYFETIELPQSSTVFSTGDVGDRLFLLVSGGVTVGLRIPGQRNLRRLFSVTPGVVFGEMAMLDALPRSADAVCDRPSVLRVLPREKLDQMREMHPELFGKLLRNIARDMSTRLRATNLQLSALET